MKTLTLFSIIIVCNVALIAQDWMPFVFGRTYYYVQYDGDEYQVETFLIDSSIYGTADEWTVFNTLLDDPWDWFFRDDLYTSLSFLINPEKPDALSVSGDIITIQGPPTEGWSFDFMPYAEVGEEWTTNGVTIKCIDMGVMDDLSVQDSFKIFQCTTIPYDTLRFILSKSHGFVQFSPFNNFDENFSGASFGPYFHLIGLKDSILLLGFQQPDFNAYFHLAPSDTLLWNSTTENYNPQYPDVTNYFEDAILSVNASHDSVQYEFIRSRFDKNGNLINSEFESTYYTRKHEGKLLANPTSWFGTIATEYGPNEIFYLTSMHLNPEKGDTITTACVDFPFAFLSGKVLSIGSDFNRSECYSTRIGLISQNEWYDNGNYSLTLIGSIIDGVADGIIEIPTATSEISLEKVNVYPNPVKDILNIPSNAESIRIFNIHGILMQSFQVSNTSIDLSDFAPGIYVLQLIDQDGNSVITRVINQ
ncbi:MAG TPA: T9SS type A sorting domain-containing protein [Saprospiraceae bacterium]|nr:T9SS type A sorting domain-containing protein [Saprospiraceae bacterium]